MKVKIIAKIKRDGTLDIGTVQGAGPNCKAIADAFAGAVGQIDEKSRGDTEDLDVKQEGTQDLTVEG